MRNSNGNNQNRHEQRQTEHDIVLQLTIELKLILLQIFFFFLFFVDACWNSGHTYLWLCDSAVLWQQLLEINTFYSSSFLLQSYFLFVNCFYKSLFAQILWLCFAFSISFFAFLHLQSIDLLSTPSISSISSHWNGIFFLS